MLFEVSSFDLLTFALVPTGLFVTSVIASVIPARRAARVSPIMTLRKSRSDRL